MKILSHKEYLKLCSRLVELETLNKINNELLEVHKELQNTKDLVIETLKNNYNQMKDIAERQSEVIEQFNKLNS